MSDLVNLLIGWMHVVPPELIEVAMLVAAYGGALLLFRQFGLVGLTAFAVLAIVGANIQVLKVVQFTVLPQPVALGTILFSSSFLAIDLITEYYGPETARRTIWLGFCCLLLHNIFMLLTLGYRPIDPATADSAAIESALTTFAAPQPALLAAGLISYLVSQHLDVALYSRLKKATHGQHLWLRNVAATVPAVLVDNTVFSVLAWQVFAVRPVSFEALIFTYILGTFFIRMLIAVLDTPFMYLSRWSAKPHVQPAQPA